MKTSSDAMPEDIEKRMLSFRVAEYGTLENKIGPQEIRLTKA